MHGCATGAARGAAQRRQGAARQERSTAWTGDTDIDVLRRHLQHGRGSGAQRILHAVTQPAGHIFAGCGKAQAVPLDMGIQGMDPHLEDAGIEDTPQIFRDLLPLLLHACHCPPMKNAGYAGHGQPCPLKNVSPRWCCCDVAVRLSAKRPQGCSFFALFCQHMANGKTRPFAPAAAMRASLPSILCGRL